MLGLDSAGRLSSVSRTITEVFQLGREADRAGRGVVAAPAFLMPDCGADLR